MNSEDRFYKDSDIDGHPIVDRKTGMIYMSRYKRELVSLLNQLAELADRATPTEYGKNRYGVDVAYFRKTINRELNRPLTDFRPDELARVFARLAKTADASVLKEPEFN